MNQRGDAKIAFIFVLLAALLAIIGIYYFYYRTAIHLAPAYNHFDQKTGETNSSVVLMDDLWYSLDIFVPPNHEFVITCEKPCEYVVGEQYTRVPPILNGKFVDYFFTSDTEDREDLRLLKINNYATVKVRTLPITSTQYNRVTMLTAPLTEDQNKGFQKIFDNEAQQWKRILFEFVFFGVCFALFYIGWHWRNLLEWFSDLF